MKSAIILITAISLFNPASAQLSGTDMVGQLISAENFFSALIPERGIKKAFLAVSDENTLVFRPDPVPAVKYFRSKHDDEGSLTWEPAYARISKSGDWGFTSGPYIYKESESGRAVYGDYLSIWKKNKNDVWKLALDLGVTHPKPAAAAKMVFSNPRNEEFQPQYSYVRLKQREQIILSSDQLFSAALKADNAIAFRSFLSNDCRLLFPGSAPVTGKTEILRFWEKSDLKLSSEPVKADRAFSGELAFTYGKATIGRKGKNKLYHYVRIWEVQPDYQWNIIMDVYTEAGAD